MIAKISPGGHCHKFTKFGETSKPQLEFDEVIVDMLACTGTSFSWVNHERTKKLARYILGIPASSATSERVFSAGGLTVTNLRCSLEDEKVEDILKIRLNLSKVEAEEKKKIVA